MKWRGTNCSRTKHTTIKIAARTSKPVTTTGREPGCMQGSGAWLHAGVGSLAARRGREPGCTQGSGAWLHAGVGSLAACRGREPGCMQGSGAWLHAGVGSLAACRGREPGCTQCAGLNPVWSHDRQIRRSSGCYSSSSFVFQLALGDTIVGHSMW